MSHRELCSAALAAYGRSIEIDDLAFDGQGLCVLAFDHKVTVNLAIDPRLGGLVLFSVLGEIGVAPAPDLFKTMLRGNFMWRVTEGATLAMDPEQDAATLMQCLPSSGLNVDTLSASLNAFVNTAYQWTQRLTETPPPKVQEFMPAMLRV